ncbi:hypothetical protein C7999DRAFT_31727 [Corynascus novoguineensis]|uniref:Uncharacterized protein n=1 Tax=Corynascus novoguineensis TaxID=1126955 RepID=A0AAN7CTR9_9PEZI|nr:hypothetical protein C7999DRAFT_31727 [Corynascus novoguineensis]
MSSADNGGIRVRRNTMVTVEGGRVPNHHDLLPVTTVIESNSAPQVSDRPKSSHCPPRTSDFLTEVTRSDSLSQWRKRMRERNTTRELIDFFRETLPPPGNLMSTPDSFEETPPKRRKRLSLWPFGKRHQRHKKTKRGLIRLPDSAVAGTTTGGHRHIAISIPVEHAHLGLEAEEPEMPTAKLSEKPLQEHRSGNEPAGPEAQSREDVYDTGARAEFPSPSDIEAGVAGKAERCAGDGNVAQDRVTYSTVGHQNMNATSTPDMDKLPTGSHDANAALMDLWPRHNRDSRRRLIARRRSPQGRRTSIKRRSIDLQLLRRPSTPESFFTTTSEFICSDAVTIHIPSPRSAPGCAGDIRHVTDTDAETKSYHTPERTASPVAVHDRDRADVDSHSESNSSLQFNFSAPYNPSTSRTSSIHEPTVSSILSWPEQPHQPLAVSSNISLEPFLPSSPSAPSLHITPILTVADLQPSPPGRGIIHPTPSSMPSLAPLTITDSQYGHCTVTDAEHAESPPSPTFPPSVSSREGAHSASPILAKNHDTLAPRITRSTNSDSSEDSSPAIPPPIPPRASHRYGTGNKNKDKGKTSGLEEAGACEEWKRETKPRKGTNRYLLAAAPPLGTHHHHHHHQRKMKSDNTTNDRNRTLSTATSQEENLPFRAAPRTPDLELAAILARLDRLEQANVRWLRAVAPLIERLARHSPPTPQPPPPPTSPDHTTTCPSSPPITTTATADPHTSHRSDADGGDNGGSEEGGKKEEEEEPGVFSGWRDGLPGPEYGCGRVGLCHGYGYGYGCGYGCGHGHGHGHGYGGLGPRERESGRLRSLTSVDTFTWEDVSGLRHREPGGIGVAQERVSEDLGKGKGKEWLGSKVRFVMDRDINEESWLKSSSTLPICSGLGPEDAVSNSTAKFGRGAPGPSFSRFGSKESLGNCSEPGLMRGKQQRRQPDWALREDERFGDATGWRALESLMHELVLGAKGIDTRV